MIKRFILIVTLLGLKNSYSNEYKHEIGWENGIRYAQKINSFILGFKVSPSYSYTEGGDPSSSISLPYSQSTLNSTRNSETRQIYFGIQGSKEINHFESVLLEPYSEIGYRFSYTESNFNSRNSNLDQNLLLETASISVSNSKNQNIINQVS